MDESPPLRSVPARCSVVHSVALARNLPCKRFHFILRLVEAFLEVVVALFFLEQRDHVINYGDPSCNPRLSREDERNQTQAERPDGSAHRRVGLLGHHDICSIDLRGRRVVMFSWRVPLRCRHSRVWSSRGWQEFSLHSSSASPPIWILANCNFERVTLRAPDPPTETSALQWDPFMFSTFTACCPWRVTFVPMTTVNVAIFSFFADTNLAWSPFRASSTLSSALRSADSESFICFKMLMTALQDASRQERERRGTIRVPSCPWAWDAPVAKHPTPAHEASPVHPEDLRASPASSAIQLLSRTHCHRVSEGHVVLSLIVRDVRNGQCKQWWHKTTAEVPTDELSRFFCPQAPRSVEPVFRQRPEPQQVLGRFISTRSVRSYSRMTTLPRWQCREGWVGGSLPTWPAWATTCAFGTSTSLGGGRWRWSTSEGFGGRFCRMSSSSVDQPWRGDRQTSGGRCRVLTDLIGKDRSSAGAPATTSRLRIVRPWVLQKEQRNASIGSEGVPGINGWAHRIIPIPGNFRTFRVSGQLGLTSGFGSLCGQGAQEKGGGRGSWGKALASWPPLWSQPWWDW